jgi:hydroxymethylpyrimidine pyrophosphatase-like HAD family hydrolase
MIQAAYVGVAMKNADQKVKDYADYVSEQDNNHSGVAGVIKRFG